MKKQNDLSNNPQYPSLNEYRKRKFLHIATAVGIGVSAAAVSIELDAEENKVSESKATEDNNQKKINEQIILLAANLGHKDFKEREKATASLISMGKKFVKDKKTELIDFMKAELAKGKKSKDPEVKERAKSILLAITPPPPKIPAGRLDGEISIAGDIAF